MVSGSKKWVSFFSFSYPSSWLPWRLSAERSYLSRCWQRTWLSWESTHWIWTQWSMKQTLSALAVERFQRSHWSLPLKVRRKNAVCLASDHYSHHSDQTDTLLCSIVRGRCSKLWYQCNEPHAASGRAVWHSSADKRWLWPLNDPHF